MKGLLVKLLTCCLNLNYRRSCEFKIQGHSRTVVGKTIMLLCTKALVVEPHIKIQASFDKGLFFFSVNFY